MQIKLHISIFLKEIGLKEKQKGTIKHREEKFPGERKAYLIRTLLEFPSILLVKVAVEQDAWGTRHPISRKHSVLPTMTV